MLKYLTIAFLLFMAGLSFWFMYSVWTTFDDVDIGFHGSFALGIGVFFTLLIGFGLMALLFFSARRGHDMSAYDILDKDEDKKEG
ncbi:hypothetical protein QGN29_09020 [Temperatibacter marinus]|uniref:Uncharacterized protein n=1 Tax=Temperatibacter marinus TaxID=1456591 RepID=A0AA52H9H7_9PROT|nr:hypothetical protein [Temperatibacter marinus]WND01700.1 hypothetical protein QGN29_09020 [Temperatibacter marinus]